MSDNYSLDEMIYDIRNGVLSTGEITHYGLEQLCDEINRLKAQVADLTAERDAMQRERDIGKGFHDIAVAQRNVAWNECRSTRALLDEAVEVLRELEYCVRPDDEGQGGTVMQHNECPMCEGYDPTSCAEYLQEKKSRGERHKRLKIWLDKLTGHNSNCNLAAVLDKYDKLVSGEKE